MAASYPGAIKSFGAITSGVTVLEASLFSDVALEIEAIETELGVGVLGTAGSIVERIQMSIDPDGTPIGLVQIWNAAATERKRMRRGVTGFRVDDMTLLTYAVRGTVSFTPALKSNCIAFLELQLLESDPSINTVPAFPTFLGPTGTTNSFSFLVSSGQGKPPAPGTSFLLHWVALDSSFPADTGY